ncbi:DUF4097 family beta strand repeat-containing protein [Halobacillus seohaensis]|uniref:DUF4097 domain-containing protein n=1 Tax=Halobacillus seohaensis TaxID=447421 RepID=A0ABW2EKR9_9BACI
MNNVKKIMILAFLLLLVGGVGSVVTFNFNQPNTFTEEKEIDSSNTEAIAISANNERVEIIPTKNIKTRVELSVGKRTRNPEELLSVEEDGNTLYIQTVNAKNKLINFDFFTGPSKLSVYLPEKLYKSLQIDIDNGSLHAEQLNVTDLNLTTKNGSITLDHISSKVLQAHSNNGKISLRNVDGEINGKTNNGSISLTTDDLDRSIELESDNGSITIETEEEPTNVILDARVGNGKITIFGDSNWDTVIGDGDHLINLTTKNGNITVTK